MAGFWALYEAIETDNFCGVRKLVDKGIDVNCSDSMKRTVLHHAAVQGKKMMVECLVGLGAAVNAMDIVKETPLHYALSEEATSLNATMIVNDPSISLNMVQMSVEESTKEVASLLQNKKIEMIECLVQLGADINATFDKYVTSLHRAVNLKNVEAINILTGLGVDVNSMKQTGMTGLNLAVTQEEPAVMKCLVQLGADVNSSYDITTALHDAMESGQGNIVAILVQNGADVNAAKSGNITQLLHGLLKNIENLEVLECLVQLGGNLDAMFTNAYPIHEAVKLKDSEMLKYLVTNGADTSDFKMNTTAIGIAISLDRYDLIEYLVNLGADINARYDTCVTALTDAVRQGNVAMVESLIHLGADIDDYHLLAETTVLFEAVAGGQADMVKYLLGLKADVNALYNFGVTVVHHTIRCGDMAMLNTLGTLGADIDFGKMEGLSVLNEALREGSEKNLEMVRALVEAGADLDEGFNENVTALHDAVRLSNMEMVENLAHLGADMNCRKKTGTKPLHQATSAGWKDIVTFFAEQGADMDAVQETEVTPLHDAVCRQNSEMVLCLVKSGADITVGKQEGVTALHMAVNGKDNEMLNCLVGVGADIDTTRSVGVTVLHTALEWPDTEILDVLFSLGLSGNVIKVDKVSLLHDSIRSCFTETTECLLNLGISKGCNQYFLVSAVEDAIRHIQQFDMEYASELSEMADPVMQEQIGSSPLHQACKFGNTDLSRLLIVCGSDVNLIDYNGATPLECLPLASTMDYHVLQEASTAEKVVEKVGLDVPPVGLCQNIDSLHHIPGIGDVQCISYPKFKDISEPVNEFVQIMMRKLKIFSGVKLRECGSAAEGTKVGLPTEMDFLFEMDTELSSAERKSITDAGCGFFKYVNPTKRLFDEGSKSFHATFAQEVTGAISYLLLLKTVDKVYVYPPQSPIIRDDDRKATSPLLIQWEDEQETFYISVDFVPCVHVDDWPEGSLCKTWLMDNQDLRRRGYNLVPKPPHANSVLATHYTTAELRALWRITFSHLETEHMQRLEQRVKDVYVTAKCLRNPDVCHIMVTDEGSLPRNVDKYITSYLLKMAFFMNVEDFLNSDQSIGEMVCKVYDDLEDGLSQGSIPMFFLPTVNVLDGLNLDVPKCAEVAKIMKRFVRALFLRDSQDDPADSEVEEEVIVYQRKSRAVYRSYEISP